MSKKILFASYGIFRNGYSHPLDGFIGDGTTVENYNLYGKGGIANATIDDDSHGIPITVSVYEVTEERFRGIDSTEGYQHGMPMATWYGRTEVWVEVEGERYLCWMYHINSRKVNPILTGDWLNQG